MAGIKISALPSAALPLTGAEVTPIVQTGNTVKVPLNSMFSASTGSSQIGFIAAGPSAVLRTAQSKLRDFVSDADFGAVGDGVTDDTAAITAFFNSANSNPGVPHLLRDKTYALSAVLPTITSSCVEIYGCGATIHDTGTLMTGTVFKWIGAAGTVGPLVKIAPITGASAQRISSVVFEGIGIDCNNGAINYGLQLLSGLSCFIAVAVANAGVTGMDVNVTSPLGAARDTQKCYIAFAGRQIEAPNGFALTCGGDATANVSMNDFSCDIQHKNVQAIYLTNTDNNAWSFVRTYKVGGGAATESVACLGGAANAERVRSERFYEFTANLPLRAYGTGTYAFPAININIYNLDNENGTPAPIVDTGASVFWKKDSTALPDTPWSDYTPVLSAGAGTLTSATATGSYAQRGKIMTVRVQIVITTNGTASSTLRFTLPIATAGTLGAVFHGKERATTGKSVEGFVDGGGQSIVALQFYDGTYPGANGYVINVVGTYEVA